MKNKTDFELLQMLWDYMHTGHTLEKADAILVLGCSDLSVVDVGVDVYKKGYADKIIFSGGLGKDTSKMWDEPEANKFAKIAIEKGIPKENILIENKSTNTGENFRFTKKLIEENGLGIKKLIIVHKPYDEKRAYAAFKNWMPEYEAVVTSMDISCEEYNEMAIKNNLPNWTELMVGDVQRMKVFAKKGWQVEVDMPDEIWNAYKELVERGYDKYVFHEK
ncbi:MAG: YdcF family protein [Clostridia bacterium]|nr:YdcF family protein [Clostridia bacterium]